MEKTKKTGLLRALVVHSLAFGVGAVVSAVLIGSVFYIVLNTSWLRDLGAIAAVISVVSGFYVAYRAAQYLREWIYHWLDPQMYGVGLMLVHLTLFIFLGSMGWQLVLKTLLLQVSPPLTTEQVVQQWEKYDYFRLQGVALPSHCAGLFTTVVPQSQPPIYQHVLVAPLLDGSGRDTLWMGVSVEQSAPLRDSLLPHPPGGYTFWKKMPWADQHLYEQAIIQAGSLGGAPHRLLQGEASSVEAYKNRVYRWILPFIGLGWAIWMVGIGIGALAQRMMR